jgi:hypothetical protein
VRGSPQGKRECKVKLAGRREKHPGEQKTVAENLEFAEPLQDQSGPIMPVTRGGQQATEEGI